MKLTNDFYINPRNGHEFTRPIFLVVGPGDPGGLVGLPFGRHSKAFGSIRDWQRSVLAEKDFIRGDYTPNSKSWVPFKGSVDEPTDYTAITVNAAVSEERPVSSNTFKVRKITLDNEELFIFLGGFL